MSCIKTGARILYTNYGLVYSADIHEVGSCYVIRFNIRSGRRPGQGFDAPTHTLVIGPEGFHAEDGTTVVPKLCVKFL